MSDRNISQAELNRRIAAERRQLEAQIAAVSTEIEQRRASQAAFATLCESHGIKTAEGESLTDAVTRWISTTESTLAQQDAEHRIALDTLTAEHEAAKTTLTERAAAVESRFHTVLIDGALTTAAKGLKAYNPEQVRELLKPHARVVGEEVIIDGFAPSVYQSPSEAVAMLHDDPAHTNLFSNRVG